jgi:hypothetical protein
MRTHILLPVAAALLALSPPARLAAQRHESFRPAIPHEPVRRDATHPGLVREPGHPPAAVPYVRDGRWYGHAAVDDPRLRLAHPFAAGRFALPGPAHVYTVARMDLGARRIWLPGGRFEVADWDWGVTAPWCWTCDDFVVYLDPDHPGWYLLYDVRMGEYVHAEFLGA